jgi:hypothetical protein
MEEKRESKRKKYERKHIEGKRESKRKREI